MLFEPEKYSKLAKISELERKSIGELLRDAVEQKYLLNESDSKKRQQMYNRIKKWQKRVGVSKTPIDYKGLIEDGRRF